MKKYFSAIFAVACAMFGVRSSSGFEEDKKLPFSTILIMAVMMVFIFIGSLMAFIKWVVLT